MTVTVPERNRAIKKLLVRTYGQGCASVTAGNGTAYHWVEIKFLLLPAGLERRTYAEIAEELEQMIRDAGIELSSWTDDMGDNRTCISIKFPRRQL